MKTRENQSRRARLHLQRFMETRESRNCWRRGLTRHLGSKTTGLNGVTKYRGTVDGRQRGEYKSVQLRALFGKEDLVGVQGSEVPGFHSPFDDFDVYLSRAGTRIGDDYGELDEGESCSSDIGVYHYGGATVLVEYFEFKKGGSRDGEITVTLVSNDPLEDVIGQLCRNFPCLRRTEPG